MNEHLDTITSLILLTLTVLPFLGLISSKRTVSSKHLMPLLQSYIFITKTKTRNNAIAICLLNLKLELKYSKN